MNTSSSRNSFRLGMYLLETLTAGMYTDSLSIYREYIQNAVDSIDLLPRTVAGEIRVTMDYANRNIVIRDNGVGIAVSNAPSVLSSVGISDKTDWKQRGFRGIGRLGGLAFAEQAIFRTKAKGETVETVQKWNCLRLRQLLTDRAKRHGGLGALYKNVVELAQHNNGAETESFFEVELQGVSSFRNHLLDFPKVIDYLAEVAPVPFHAEKFLFGGEIDSFIHNNVKGYRAYSLFLNDLPIYKRYRNEVSLVKGGRDVLVDVKRVSLFNDAQEPLAYGWYGVRDGFLGGITKDDGTGGLRVRVGNIQVGDGHLLDQCFREPRFNGYVIGEIHIASEKLIPNSRRDDFIDNQMKADFINAVEKEIGLPLSKEIRRRSREAAAKDERLVSGNVTAVNGKSSQNCAGNKSYTGKEIIDTCNNCPNREEIIALIKLMKGLDDTDLLDELRAN